MSLTAPHIDFVLASYGLSALILGGLVGVILWQARRTNARLSELEQRSHDRAAARQHSDDR